MDSHISLSTAHITLGQGDHISLSAANRDGVANGFWDSLRCSSRGNLEWQDKLEIGKFRKDKVWYKEDKKPTMVCRVFEYWEIGGNWWVRSLVYCKTSRWTCSYIHHPPSTFTFTSIGWLVAKQVLRNQIAVHYQVPSGHHLTKDVSEVAMYRYKEHCVPGLHSNRMEGTVQCCNTWRDLYTFCQCL